MGKGVVSTQVILTFGCSNYYKPGEEHRVNMPSFFFNFLFVDLMSSTSN